ncbi:MAG: UTP--glucose-1-phosphate uridylyltransferase GalU [Gammaproteobacteria bacterium]|nr:UTP--glucose-1-phosphate uridylyltransferase GalU [Gammaproteobacteria bacterium]
MTYKVTKAVFPVAGMGTRFLPATKANPKEMLPIVDKPLIQYAAEEAIAAGIKQLIFVTSSAKRAIEDHFDKNYELESELIARNKRNLLRMVQDILPKGVSCAYIRQPEALGLGHAVLCARPAIGNEPFAVILADDLIDNGDRNCLSQMVDLFEERGCSLLGVEQIDPSETDKYGVITPKPLSKRLYQAESIVEKPRPEEAPSALAVVGRYILTPGIFEYLENLGKGTGGEIQLTDAIAQLMGSETVLAYEFDGIRYDCGSKLGYLQATVEYALKHPDLQQPFREYLQKFCLLE